MWAGRNERKRMSMGFLRYICLLLIIGGGGILSLQAQRSDSLKHRGLIHRIGTDVRVGYIAPTHAFFKGDNAKQKKMSEAYAAHLKYAFLFRPDSKWGRLYPHTYQGIGVGYHYLSNKQEMGNPVSIYVFQGSRIAQLAPRLSLDYEWNFGASFGWEKYHETANPYNTIVGSKVNAYINLGCLLNWQLGRGWNLTAGADFTHFSNGNTNYPNSGVNTIGGRVGLTHTFATDQPAPVAKEKIDIERHISYDVVVYVATKRKGVIHPDRAYLAPGAFGVVGLNFNPMYNFHRYFRAGASLDVQYDESANIKDHEAGDWDGETKFYRPSFREQFAVGVSARGELVMPIFTVNLGVGYNVWQKGADTRGFYQVLALKTAVTRSLFLHVGYKLNKFKDPDNLMLGIGYRFNNKR